MKTLIPSILAFALLAIGDTASAQIRRQPVDLKLVALFANQKAPINGPNCADAALIALGIRLPVMHLDPGLTANEILPSCLAPTSRVESGTVAALFDSNNDLIHLFTFLNEHTVFTKNGLEKSEPYQITEASEVFRAYQGQFSRVRYYKWAPSERCVISHFVSILNRNPELRSYSNTMLNLIIGKKPILLPTYRKLDALFLQSRKHIGPMAELMEDFAGSLISLPLFKKDRQQDKENTFERYIAKNTKLPVEAVHIRAHEIEHLYKGFLNFLEEEKVAPEILESLQSESTFSWWPANQNDIKNIALLVPCDLSTYEKCMIFQKTIDEKLEELQKENIVYHGNRQIGIATKNWIFSINQHRYQLIKIQLEQLDKG